MDFVTTGSNQKSNYRRPSTATSQLKICINKRKDLKIHAMPLVRHKLLLQKCSIKPTCAQIIYKTIPDYM